MTGSVSLALPLKDGVVLFDGDAGWANVTSGEEVLIAKVTALLAPSGLPRELFWVARAVYSPFANGVTVLASQLPPVTSAVSVVIERCGLKSRKLQLLFQSLNRPIASDSVHDSPRRRPVCVALLTT